MKNMSVDLNYRRFRRVLSMKITELIDRILLWLPTSLSLSLVKTLSLAWFHRRKAVERTRAEEREERLHLHLNLAVDLAVVRGHRSCRGKGRL